MARTKKCIIAIKESQIEVFNSVPACAKLIGLSESVLYKADLNGSGAQSKGWRIVRRQIKTIAVDSES